MKFNRLILISVLTLVSCGNSNKDVDEFYQLHHADSQLIRRFDGVFVTPRGAYYIIELLEFDHLTFRVMQDGRIFNSDSSIAAMRAKYGIDAKSLIDSLYSDFQKLKIVGLYGHHTSWYSFEFSSGTVLVYMPDTSRVDSASRREFDLLKSRSGKTYDDKWFAYKPLSI
jgi:hypothetical protein